MEKLDTRFLLKDQEVSENKYYEMLGCLPPERLADNAFLVGEPTDHAEDLSGKFGPRFDLYFSENGKYYYGGLASVNDFEVFLLPDYKRRIKAQSEAVTEIAKELTIEMLGSVNITQVENTGGYGWYIATLKQGGKIWQGFGVDRVKAVEDLKANYNKDNGENI